MYDTVVTDRQMAGTSARECEKSWHVKCVMQVDSKVKI